MRFHCIFVSMEELKELDERKLGEFYWNTIDESRKAKKYSWETLARISHLKRNTIAIARGESRALGLEETVGFCKALDLSIDSLCPFFDCRHDAVISTDMDFQFNETLSAKYWAVIDMFRKASHKSWEDIAGETGIKRSTISTARSYGRSLPFYKSCSICVVFGISIGAVVAMITDNEVEDSTLSARIKRLSPKHLQMISDLVDIMLASEDRE